MMLALLLLAQFQSVHGTLNQGTAGTDPWPVTISGGVTLSATSFDITDRVGRALGVVSVTGTVAVTQSGTWNIGTLASITNPVGVTGTFWQSTQPVSLVTLPALTAGSAIIGSISNAFALDSTLSTMSAKLPSALDGSGFLKVHEQGTALVSATLAMDSIGLAKDATLTGGTLKAEPYDGTNVIGTSAHPVRTDPTGGTAQPVTIATLPSLAAGTAVIGHVIADSGSTTAVTQATAANLNATVTQGPAGTSAWPVSATALPMLTGAGSVGMAQVLILPMQAAQALTSTSTKSVCITVLGTSPDAVWIGSGPATNNYQFGVPLQPGDPPMCRSVSSTGLLYGFSLGGAVLAVDYLN